LRRVSRFSSDVSEERFEKLSVSLSQVSDGGAKQIQNASPRRRNHLYTWTKQARQKSHSRISLHDAYYQVNWSAHLGVTVLPLPQSL
jgi:hypothetical protein